MAMNWIAVGDAVPEDRKSVLTWGFVKFLGRTHSGATGELLGLTKYNRKRNGHGEFDNEGGDGWGIWHSTVTHWMPIEGPAL